MLSKIESRNHETSPAAGRQRQIDSGFTDHRPAFKADTSLLQIMSRNAVPTMSKDAVTQRAVGTAGDNDRAHISVENLAGNERVNAHNPRGYAAAAVVLAGSFTVNGLNTTGAKLKHYMVAKSGTSYQLPIKHAREPLARGGGRFDPNAGVQDNVRGNKPEPFGGNFDLPGRANVNNELLTTTRDQVLGREYEEEGHPARGGDGAGVLGAVARARKYRVNHDGYHAAGTLSIVNLTNAMDVQSQVHPVNQVNERGRAEMAGTITIDCNDLIQAANQDGFDPAVPDQVRAEKDRIEDAIGVKIRIAHAAHRGLADDPARDLFSHQAGILSHLVTMISEDVYEARMERIRLALEAARLVEEARVALAAEQQRQLDDERRIRAAIEARLLNRIGAQLKKPWVIALIGVIIAFIMLQMSK